MNTLSVKTVILGDPVSPRHQINPVLLANLLEQIQNSASTGSNLFFEDTFVQLVAVNAVEGDIGFVLNNGDNNGTYRFQGSGFDGAWVQTAELPPAFAASPQDVVNFATLLQTYLPGEVPRNFTQTLTGAPAAGVDPVGQVVEAVGDGSFYRLDGAEVIGVRERIYLDTGRRYQVKWRVRRETNPTDPAGDTVRLGVVWLDGLKAQIQNSTIQDVTLTEAMGEYEIRRFYNVNNGIDDDDFTVPAGAVYMVPYVQTFGADGVTDVLQLGWDEIASALVSPPPVARTFYITSDGDDANSGSSLSSPLATITAAVAKMAALAPASCITVVHPGEYLVPPNTEIPANCALYGYDLRVTKLILSNAAGTAAATGTQRNNNMFLMTSGIKARGFTFTGMQHEAYTLEGGPPATGYAFAFKPGEVITRSPYIADCSVLHDLTQDQLKLPIDKAAGNPLMPLGAGNILADGSVLDLDSPLRSVVVDSFTSINPNGVGYAVTRSAFVQLVSVFTNWSRVGIWAHQGGQITMANSNNTFGDYAFASTSFRNVIRIEDTLAGLSVQTASAALITSQLEAIVTNLMTVRYPTLTGWGGLTPAQIELTERDTRTLLTAIINDLNSGQDKAAQAFAKGLFNWNAQYAFATSLLQLFVDSWEQVRLELLARLSVTAAENMVTALIGLITDVAQNPATYRVGFPSVIEATGQQFSNAGSGVNYNSLPFSQRGTGENPDPLLAIYKDDGGKVYATFSTEVGDTYLGEDLRVDFERSTIEGQAFSRGVQNIALPLIIGLGG